jgi:hypothetical protein
LLEKGIIDHLPWYDYLKPQADFVDEAAVEAKKWADENPDTEESEKAKEWAKNVVFLMCLGWNMMNRVIRSNASKKTIHRMLNRMSVQFGNEFKTPRNE